MAKFRTLLVAPLGATVRNELYLPLGLMCLASHLNQHGVSSDILDLSLRFCAGSHPEKIDLLSFQLSEIDDVIRRCDYDLIGITGFCDSFAYSIAIAWHVKKKWNKKIVIGGPYATFVAKEVLENFDFVDFVIKHEGTGPLLKLCNILKNGTPCAFHSCPNLVYREQNSIAENGIDNNFNILSEQFSIDYSLIPVKKYLQFNPSLEFPIFVGFGCPYDCTFCSTSLMWYRKYRIRPLKNIFKDVEILATNYGIKSFDIIHDNISFDTNLLKDLSAVMKKYNVSWSFAGRLDNPTIQFAKQAVLRKFGRDKLELFQDILRYETVTNSLVENFDSIFFRFPYNELNQSALKKGNHVIKEVIGVTLKI